MVPFGSEVSTRQEPKSMTHFLRWFINQNRYKVQKKRRLTQPGALQYDQLAKI